MSSGGKETGIYKKTCGASKRKGLGRRRLRHKKKGWLGGGEETAVKFREMEAKVWDVETAKVGGGQSSAAVWHKWSPLEWSIRGGIGL